LTVSASDLADRLREQLREDAAAARANPGREVAETVILGVVGLGWLLRSVAHIYGYLIQTDDGDPHPLTTEWGVASSPVLAASPEQRWRMAVGTCGLAVLLAAAMQHRINIWQSGPVIGGLVLANWLVLVADPILVQLLPEGEA
jgi:hypothetical protein